jgi:glycosyltransferase involved in cell wall biosynthesis
MANLQKGVLDKVKHFLDKKGFAYEVLIVDDGSKDGSIPFLHKFIKENKNFRLIQNPHFGKAGAVTTGILKSEGEFLLFTDMDQATPIEELDKLLPYFKKGYEVVIGSRNNTRKGAPLLRLLISRGNILLRKTIVGINEIEDTQCGFKMFTRQAGQKIFSKLNTIHNGFHAVGGSNVASGFDVEALYIAKVLGYKIKEVPVSWLYVETRRVNPVTDSVKGVLSLLEIKKNALAGKYN